MTWGAVMSNAAVASMVKSVNVMRQRRSSTMAANFQSFSEIEKPYNNQLAVLRPPMLAAASSSLSLSVITLISFRMATSSRWTPELAKLSS